MKPTGYIIYEGPSLLDREPIVFICTLQTNNSKTGPMVQTWILRRDIEPHLAIKSGADSSVCGDCIHRGKIINGKNIERTCYVRTEQAPLNIYRAYRRGNYLPLSSLDVFKNQKVRLGSYGDPGVIPFKILQDICLTSDGWTGYSHAWQRIDPIYNQVCMASCETEWEMEKAKKLGYRVFRILGPNEGPTTHEFICPASPQGGDRLQCNECLACSGTRMGKLTPKSGVVIYPHGKSWVPIVLTRSISERIKGGEASRKNV